MWEFIRLGLFLVLPFILFVSCYKTPNKYYLVFCWLLFSVHSSEATLKAEHSRLTNVACSWGSKPGINALCGLSLLLALSFAQRGFFLQVFWFSHSQNPTFPNSNLILIARTHLNKFLRSPKCFVGKQITVFFLNGLLHLTQPSPPPPLMCCSCYDLLSFRKRIIKKKIPKLIIKHQLKMWIRKRICQQLQTKL